MKKYHGTRNQHSYEDKEEYVSPREMIDKVSDDDFIDVVNEIVSDRWLKKYNTEWLSALRKEINEQRVGYIPERKKNALSKAILAWCEARDVHFGVGLTESEASEDKYFFNVASSVATNLLEYPFGEVQNFDEILNEHSSEFQRKGDGIHGFSKATTPFIKENKELLLMAYRSYLNKIEDSIIYREYDKDRVQTAERLGFSNVASHAQSTRIFQDSIVAFSNQRTLDELIKRASGNKKRLSKMMRRDLGLEKSTLMSEAKKANGVKNLKLFYSCLDSVL